MSRIKEDLRTSEFREAIVDVANTMRKIKLTDRALALLISDASGISMTAVLKVLESCKTLDQKYLKKGV